MNNPLELLWNSTQELPKRFALSVEINAQMRKFFEEVYEFTEVITREQFLIGEPEGDLEAADVLVTMILALQVMGWTYEEFEAAILKVAQKNNAKTPETHSVYNGQITRKSKLKQMEAPNEL